MVHMHYHHRTSRFLNNNKLSGTIPTSIGRLVALAELCASRIFDRVADSPDNRALPQALVQQSAHREHTYTYEQSIRRMVSTRTVFFFANCGSTVIASDVQQNSSVELNCFVSRINF
jgi:hypothetical protein